MQISVYDLTVPQFTLSLKALKNVLNKSQAFATTKKIEMSVLLQTRLAPDQFPLIRQIQISTDLAKGCAFRLTGVEAPVFEDKDQTCDELLQRIDKTISYLQTIKPEQFEGYEKKTVKFPWKPGVYLEGKPYLVQHALPNFYFHITTAYAILRHCGVELGKGDFLGEQSWMRE